MAYIKKDTKVYANDPAGKEAVFSWMMSKILTRGWTLEWSAYSGTDAPGIDRFYALKRTVTYSDGTTQPYFLIYESEPGANDLIQYCWDGVKEYASWEFDQRPMNQSSNWPLYYQNAPVSYWEDDASDGYLFIHQNRVQSFQLPDGGFINNGPNTGEYNLANTRPYYAFLPISTEWDGSGWMLDGDFTSYTMNAMTPHKKEIARPAIWTDYCAVAQTSDSNYPYVKTWEDQSGTWKMWAEKGQRNFRTEGIEVAKIGDEYYLNLGQFLVPAGQAEPEL